MSATPSQPALVMPAEQAGADHPADSAARGPAGREGRVRRIVLIAAASLMGVAAAAAFARQHPAAVTASAPF